MFLLARLHADLGQFDDSRQLLERCLMLQQHVLNTADGKWIVVKRNMLGCLDQQLPMHCSCLRSSQK